MACRDGGSYYETAQGCGGRARTHGAHRPLSCILCSVGCGSSSAGRPANTSCIAGRLLTRTHSRSSTVPNTPRRGSSPHPARPIPQGAPSRYTSNTIHRTALSCASVFVTAGERDQATVPSEIRPALQPAGRRSRSRGIDVPCPRGLFSFSFKSQIPNLNRKHELRHGRELPPPAGCTVPPWDIVYCALCIVYYILYIVDAVGRGPRCVGFQPSFNL